MVCWPKLSHYFICTLTLPCGKFSSPHLKHEPQEQCYPVPLPGHYAMKLQSCKSLSVSVSLFLSLTPLPPLTIFFSAYKADNSHCRTGSPREINNGGLFQIWKRQRHERRLGSGMISTTSLHPDGSLCSHSSQQTSP